MEANEKIYRALEDQIVEAQCDQDIEVLKILVKGYNAHDMLTDTQHKHLNWMLGCAEIDVKIYQIISLGPYITSQDLLEDYRKRLYTLVKEYKEQEFCQKYQIPYGAVSLDKILASDNPDDPGGLLPNTARSPKKGELGLMIAKLNAALNRGVSPSAARIIENCEKCKKTIRNSPKSCPSLPHLRFYRTYYRLRKAKRANRATEFELGLFACLGNRRQPHPCPSCGHPIIRDPRNCDDKAHIVGRQIYHAKVSIKSANKKGLINGNAPAK